MVVDSNLKDYSHPESTRSSTTHTTSSTRHMSVTEELQSAVASVADGVGPSIVGIGRGTRGSGVVIAKGKVLTNAHNLRGDEVTVTFADGRREIGKVAGYDGDGDLTVIDVDTGSAAAVEWAD